MINFFRRYIAVWFVFIFTVFTGPVGFAAPTLGSSGVGGGGSLGAIPSCFEATISRAFNADETSPVTDNTTVDDGITILTWADTDKTYSPPEADSAGNLRESATADIAFWEWDRGVLSSGDTTRLSVEISGSYKMGASQTAEFMRFNVAFGLCPNNATLVGGDFWNIQPSGSRMFFVNRTIDIPDQNCFGIAVGVDQTTANTTLTLDSILVHVAQVSTPARPCT